MPSGTVQPGVDGCGAGLQVCSLTWSFSGPDGRALLAIGPDSDGEPLLAWLAIGYHHSYQ
jgi:hypothetical protein